MKTAKIMYSQGAEEKHYTFRNQLTSKQIRQKVYSQAIFSKLHRHELISWNNKIKKGKQTFIVRMPS